MPLSRMKTPAGLRLFRVGATSVGDPLRERDLYTFPYAHECKLLCNKKKKKAWHQKKVVRGRTHKTRGLTRAIKRSIEHLPIKRSMKYRSSKCTSVPPLRATLLTAPTIDMGRRSITLGGTLCASAMRKNRFLSPSRACSNPRDLASSHAALIQRAATTSGSTEASASAEDVVIGMQWLVTRILHAQRGR